MSASVLYMSMSLDGFIAGPNDSPDNPGGDDFMRLHEWFGFATEAGPDAEVSDTSGIGKQFLDEINATGAVLSGRNTVEQTDHWGGRAVLLLVLGTERPIRSCVRRLRAWRPYVRKPSGPRDALSRA